MKKTHTLKERVRRATGLLYAVPFIAIQPGGKENAESLTSGLFKDGSGLGDMLNTAFQIAINVGAILAMMRIMWAGWLYMGSADMWSNKHKAKEVFQDAIIGLLILLAIWIILYQINPCILDVTFFENGRGSGECRGAANVAPSMGQ